MMRIRRAAARGYFDYGWLQTYHTFSFNEFHDPEYRHFRKLRVMNEDVVQPGQGFGTHPHRDMEIVTYVLSGALEHRDSMGHGETLRPGELQRMSAGSGITHSEFNPSADEPVHLYQIWLFPREKGLEPSYEQRSFPVEMRTDRWQLVASPDAAKDSLLIHQDARILLANLSADVNLTYTLSESRHAWLQVLRGAIELEGESLTAGDGAAMSDLAGFRVHASQASELMLFDLA